MKKFYNFLLAVLMVCLSIQPAYAKEDLKLNSEYAYLYDPMTSLVYIDQKAEEKIYPASMTKILTVALSLEKITDISQRVVITHADLAGLAKANASVAGFYEQEVVTYEDLLYGALLPSGADTCNALARLLFDNKENMVQAMNRKINDLNLTNTHFENVTGLHDDNHYTTPKEMAVILADALKNKEFVKIFESRKHTSSSKRLTWKSSLQRGHEMKGIDISHIDGGKSGFTDEAKLTFASTMTVDGHQLILITAKADGQYSQNHVKDVVNVYNYMNRNYCKFIVYKKDEKLYDYFVMNTFDILNTYYMPDEINLLLHKNNNLSAIEKKIKKKSLLCAPIQVGDQLGQIDIAYQGKIIYQYPFYAYETIDKNIFSMLCIYGGALAIVGLGIIKLKRRR